MQQTTTTKFYIGLKTQDNNEIHPSEVIEFIKNRISAGSFLEAKGLWKDETENSIVFEVVDFHDALHEDLDYSIREFKELLEEEFKQDSVMVTQRKEEVVF